MNEVVDNPDNASSRAFDEKAFRRETHALWEQRWHGLSHTARFYFLHYSRTLTHPKVGNFSACERYFAGLPPTVSDDMAAAGLLEEEPPTSRGPANRVFVREDARDFAARVLLARHFQMLGGQGQLARYIDEVYFSGPLLEVLTGVVRAVGKQGFSRLSDILEHQVMNDQWPGCVAASLREALAERVLDLIWNNKGPMTVAELTNQIKESEPDKVRTVVNTLVGRLALFEDIRQPTWELVVGFLPAVRDKLILARLPRERPPLVVCKKPREFGPEGSPIANDVRTVLIEVASQPPKLRQDLGLFQSEVERFLAVLDPIAPWLLQAMKWSADGRPSRAINWARVLELATIAPDGKHLRLRLTPRGQSWLSDGAAEDQLPIFELLLNHHLHGDLYSPQLGLVTPGINNWNIVGPADAIFLGTSVVAIEQGRNKRQGYYGGQRPDALLALRTHLDRAFSVLEPGTFYRVDSVLSHIVFADQNPLNLGLPAEKVVVYDTNNQQVPAARPQREEVARRVLEAFVRERLVPFGCVRAAIDDERNFCIAREGRYDAYFGRQVAGATVPAAAATIRPKVVIQPDFSVVVIGPNPAPAAAIAPFCERSTRGGSQGAIVMKITRESVIKAVNNGLNAAEIVARLERHATNEVPANVLRQVQEWATWVREVKYCSLIGLRCPDSDTADRVVAVLRRQAMRVDPTLVAIDREKLTPADVKKLEGQGILVTVDLADQRQRRKSR